MQSGVLFALFALFAPFVGGLAVMLIGIVGGVVLGAQRIDGATGSSAW